METMFGSPLQMQERKIDCDFCSLLLSNFNPDFAQAHVAGNRHVIIIEFDVEEIFGL